MVVYRLTLVAGDVPSGDLKPLFGWQGGQLHNAQGKILGAKSISNGDTWCTAARLNDRLRREQTFKDRPQNGLTWVGSCRNLMVESAGLREQLRRLASR